MRLREAQHPWSDPEFGNAVRVWLYDNMHHLDRIPSTGSMLVHLAPPGRSGEFFGLYAIAGTVTVWIGPMLVEFFTNTFNSQRIGMASIAALFVIGLAVLTTVKMEKAH